MNQREVLSWMEKLQGESTQDLVKAEVEHDKQKYPEEAFAAIHSLLWGRQPLPPEPVAEVPRPPEISLHDLPVKGNARVGIQGTKCEIHFPKEGFMTPERHKFDNWNDLFRYVREVFGLPEQEEMRYSMKRKGRYQRVDKNGTPVYTFGDPVLDLVTDPQGWLGVGGENYSLRTMPCAVAGDRIGGIRSVDLTPHLDQIRQAQIAEAMTRGEKYVLVQAEGDVIQLASRIPDKLWFYSGVASMRFHAWKNDYRVYWSMGGEIETWKGHFSSAKISSIYGLRGGGNICQIQKRDSDEDRDDDYVDEYEWGSFSSPPTGVRSWCQAYWFGKYYQGTVQAGGCDTFSQY